MKKRFTIMLEETTIELLKKLAAKRSPIPHREDLECVLFTYAENELERLEKHYNFNDGEHK